MVSVRSDCALVGASGRVSGIAASCSTFSLRFGDAEGDGVEPILSVGIAAALVML